MAVTDDQLKALGRLTVEFSFLEFLLTYLAWQLSGDRNSAMIFTSHLPFQRLCHAAVALVRQKMAADQAAAAKLEEITGRAMGLESDRNRLIHSVWMELPSVPGSPPPAPGGGMSRLKITARGRLDLQLETDIPAQEINRVADAIHETASEVAVFLGQHGLIGVT
jgi:hypothetical protein